MKSGLIVLFIIPAAMGLVILNSVAWVLASLRASGLPVKMGVGWPWIYYSYAVNRVGPSEWDLSGLLLDLATAAGILLAVAVIVWSFTKDKKAEGWR